MPANAVVAAAAWYNMLLPNDLANYMTEGGKDAIKKTGDHNWHMERMQFQKERGNVSGENDYVGSKGR